MKKTVIRLEVDGDVYLYYGSLLYEPEIGRKFAEVINEFVNEVAEILEQRRIRAYATDPGEGRILVTFADD